MKKVTIGTGSAEIVEKKSRFIATAFQISSEAQALEIIEKTKKQYWDARHNCYAFVCGSSSEVQRFSDDGEPSGTAGRPILDVINGAGLCNTLIIVTRYFGGILLGTGGLVRAYSKASSAVIDEMTAAGNICEICKGSRDTFICDYKDIGRIENIMAEMNIPSFEKDYGEKVTITAATSEDSRKPFIKAAQNAANGNIAFADSTEIYFCISSGKAVEYRF